MFPWNMLPFNKDMKNMMQQMKPEEIEKYVQEMMGKMFPQNMQSMMGPDNFLRNFNPFNNASGNETQNSMRSSSSIQSSVFETHDHVFVRIPINDENWLSQLKLYHTSNQLILEHIPEHNDKHTITLPAIVKKKGSTAHHKDGTLEIKIPKNIDMQFSEIDVTEIL